MNKRWINTRVIFEWDGTQYVEKTVEGYWYEGQLSLADVNHYAGHGAGGGKTRFKQPIWGSKR